MYSSSVLYCDGLLKYEVIVTEIPCMFVSWLNEKWTQ